MYEGYIIASQSNNNSAQFSGLFDDIIKGISTGLNVFKTLGGSTTIGSGGVSQSSKLTGSAIAPAAQKIIGQLNQLLAAMQGNQIPVDQIGTSIDAGNNLAHILWDSTVFDTDGGHSILLPYQNQAVSIMQQVGAAAVVIDDAVRAGTYVPNTTATTGGTTTTAGLSSVLNDPIVLYGGLALLAFTLLKK